MPSLHRILLVEDDDRVTATLQRYLVREGYDVVIESSGDAALRRIAAATFDLVVLDVMLPHVDGFDVCRAVRARSRVPIIMLTGRTALDDRLRGLDQGADDYITKPFSPREVVARIRAVLRRVAERPVPEVFAFGPVRIDLAARNVTLDDTPVRLTNTEYKLLETMVRSDGVALSRTDLIERAIGWDFLGNTRTLDTHILNLRAKLGRAATAIATVVGVGYRFDGGRLDE
jgi:two-component system alkaline phosphatase synthesis response regulator PhoP